jgi:S-formylglutathione hydrolase FrmB
MKHLTAADASNGGQLLRETIKSKSLTGNLLGDPAERSILIYPPPSYSDCSRKRFPVLYLLYRYGKTNSGWINRSYEGFSIKTELDAQINKGAINEIFVVMPDANNKYNGSYYGNSPVTGDWESFIADELVATIDKEYRTLPNRENRGIAGHSMGGFGALRLAVTYTEKFSAVYSMSPGPTIDPQLTHN